MNACVKYAASRAARFNLWALVAIMALAGVFVVKAQMNAEAPRLEAPARHFEAPAQVETAR